VVGPGSSLRYFTGAEWGLSERFFGFVLGRRGDPVWVVPGFERDRGLEQIRVGGDVRAWQEDESPHALLAQALTEQGATGRVGIEEAMPFAFSDGVAQAAPALRLASATPVSAGCRMVKDAHELPADAPLGRNHAARAPRRSSSRCAKGVTVGEASAWSAAAHRRLGGRGGSLVLFGPRRGLPARHREAANATRGRRRADRRRRPGPRLFERHHAHGRLRAAPSDRQRRVWDVVRKAQQAAFAAARPGVECQAIDAAARKVIEDSGFGPATST
jgi:Xaa-Pro dipeptidase